MALSQYRGPQYPNARPNAYEVGMEYQDFVLHQMSTRYGISIVTYSSRAYQIGHGESVGGAEVKLDDRCTDTKRLSIEVAEKTRCDPALPWVPSGILRDDNSWMYIQGNRKIIFVFMKNWLVRYYRDKAPKIEEYNGTLRRFYLPFEAARVGAGMVIEVMDEAH